MAIDEKMERAWKICEFCSKSDMEIKIILKDRKRWNELPIGHLCGWKRISQVAFRTGFARWSGMWRDLCSYRSEVCNMPSNDWNMPSDWVEGYCEAYVKANK